MLRRILVPAGWFAAGSIILKGVMEFPASGSGGLVLVGVFMMIVLRLRTRLGAGG